MKSLICALIIFLILTVSIFVNSFYVKNTMEHICDLTLKLEDSENAEEKNAVVVFWTDNRILLSLSIEADELERMNDLIETLRTIDVFDERAELQKHCRLIRELAAELSSYESISIDGIL